MDGLGMYNTKFLINDKKVWNKSDQLKLTSQTCLSLHMEHANFCILWVLVQKIFILETCYKKHVTYSLEWCVTNINFPVSFDVKI